MRSKGNAQEISEKGYQQSNNASGSEDNQANAGQMVLERFLLKKMKVIQ